MDDGGQHRGHGPVHGTQVRRIVPLPLPAEQPELEDSSESRATSEFAAAFRRRAGLFSCKLKTAGARRAFEDPADLALARLNLLLWEGTSAAFLSFPSPTTPRNCGAAQNPFEVRASIAYDSHLRIWTDYRPRHQEGFRQLMDKKIHGREMFGGFTSDPTQGRKGK
jgi:hypothetical protein